jgi:hypothetical protein
MEIRRPLRPDSRYRAPAEDDKTVGRPAPAGFRAHYLIWVAKDVSGRGADHLKECEPMHLRRRRSFLMTAVIPESSAAAAGAESVRASLDPVTRRVAIGLLVVFVVAIVALFWMRADEHWDRLVYVFGGLEAIVFASAGALFGTTVQRGAVAAAEAATQQARASAAQAQADARSSAVDAAKGQTLAAAVKAVTAEGASDRVGQSAGDQRYGARPDSQLSEHSASDPGLQALARVASQLFPDSKEEDT